MVIGGLLVALSVYSIESYGFTLFILVPIIMGYSVAALIGFHPKADWKDALGYTMIAMLLLSSAMLFFAIEGLICLIMAAPLAALCALGGAVLGLVVHKNCHDKAHRLWALFLLSSPFLMAFEREVVSPTALPVTTTIEIDASPQQVWDQIIEFPHLAEPEEWFFKTG